MSPNVEHFVLLGKDILWSGPERAQQRTVAADSHLLFPQVEEIKIIPLGKAQSIVETGEKEKQRRWTPPVDTYLDLERALNAGCEVFYSSRPRSGDVPLEEVHGSPPTSPAGRILVAF